MLLEHLLVRSRTNIGTLPVHLRSGTVPEYLMVRFRYCTGQFNSTFRYGFGTFIGTSRYKCPKC